MTQRLARSLDALGRSVDLDGFRTKDDTLTGEHLFVLITQDVHADLFGLGFFPRKGELGLELKDGGRGGKSGRL